MPWSGGGIGSISYIPLLRTPTKIYSILNASYLSMYAITTVGKPRLCFEGGA
jgi:hypothetical protein